MSDILSAIDRALLKTEPSQTPLSDGVISEVFRIGGRTKRDFPHEIGQPVIVDLARFVDWMSYKPLTSDQVAAWGNLRAQALAKSPEAASLFPETPAGMVAQDVFALAAPGETKTLRDREAWMGKLAKDMEPFSLSNVSKRQHALRDAQEADILAGTATSAVILPTREALQRDSLQRLQAFERALVKITHEEVVPVCQAILGRFNALVSDFMRRTEVADREACAIQGLEFVPSVQWRAAASVLISSQVRLPNPAAWALPSRILAGIIEL